jgi:hypothetical protein
LTNAEEFSCIYKNSHYGRGNKGYCVWKCTCRGDEKARKLMTEQWLKTRFVRICYKSKIDRDGDIKKYCLVIAQEAIVWVIDSVLIVDIPNYILDFVVREHFAPFDYYINEGILLKKKIEKQKIN